MKRLYLIILMFISLILIVSCDDAVKDSAQREQSKQTALAMNEAQRQVGMPNIINFQQRKLLKMVYELADKENLVCYAYIKSDYQGKLFFIGKCIGYGVPFSAQYTSPTKVADVEDVAPYNPTGYHFVTVPQADPNGLYMPTSSSATWLMMIDPKTNKPRPVYIEPEIVVSPFKLH